jgi:hypothetical protein
MVRLVRCAGQEVKRTRKWVSRFCNVMSSANSDRLSVSRLIHFVSRGHYDIITCVYVCPVTQSV